MRWASILLLLVGCDRVFALTPVNPGADARGDGNAVDALGPQPCAPTTAHDEDGDGLVDNCDSCPTVVSTPPVDTDSDGLGDSCDPNLSMSVDGDKILLASVFASTSELSASYSQGGTVNAIVSSDTLVLQGDCNATTVMLMTPTKIVAQVAQFTTNGTGQYIDMFTFGGNGLTCSISPVGCNNEQGMICISLGTPETKAIPASAVMSVSLWSDSTGSHCEVATASGKSGSSSTGSFTSSKDFARTSNSARMVLTSLVFYGEK